VIGVIADIDRPWGGFVKVSQQPILDLQTSLARLEESAFPIRSHLLSYPR